ncbi:hypothetical protein [Peribacillus sp. FSL M8-0224]|uniref:hypothetical protein n=1 Tax=Peribacillus sp. FSL M8-0224 TaxID=2921568 RepID=UPI0030F56C9C
MLFHIIVGFILPWILGAYLVTNQTKLFITFYPVGVAISILLNEIGFNYFWRMDIVFQESSLTGISYDLGLNPILGCLFICVIHYKKLPFLITFLVFPLVTTFGEYILVCLEKIVYRNEWNIIWTGVSYLFAYSIFYVYYKLVCKFILLN